MLSAQLFREQQLSSTSSGFLSIHPATKGFYQAVRARAAREKGFYTNAPSTHVTSSALKYAAVGTKPSALAFGWQAPPAGKPASLQKSCRKRRRNHGPLPLLPLGRREPAHDRRGRRVRLVLRVAGALRAVPAGRAGHRLRRGAGARDHFRAAQQRDRRRRRGDAVEAEDPRLARRRRVHERARLRVRPRQRHGLRRVVRPRVPRQGRPPEPGARQAARRRDPRERRALQRDARVLRRGAEPRLRDGGRQPRPGRGRRRAPGRPRPARRRRGDDAADGPADGLGRRRGAGVPGLLRLRRGARAALRVERRAEPARGRRRL